MYRLFCTVGLLASIAWEAHGFLQNSASSQIPPPPAAVNKPQPTSIADLKEIQDHTRKVLEKVIPCTVGIRAGGASGSGVIISRDGYVLTAGHVSGQPGRDVTIILNDGKQLKGKSLGMNRSIDSGLIKIDGDGPFPFADMGKSSELKPGQWVIATGHPGGFDPRRTPPVRLGRISRANNFLIQTDCTLVGGDSGGPLWNMQGQVVGIHSRIDGPITSNIHVPVDTYRDTWDRLVKGEAWGAGLGVQSTNVYMGVRGDPESKECRLAHIVPDGPAAKAGLQVDDVITKFDNHPVTTYDEMRNLLVNKKPGDKVKVEVRRGNELLKLEITLGKRPAE